MYKKTKVLPLLILVIILIVFFVAFALQASSITTPYIKSEGRVIDITYPLAEDRPDRCYVLETNYKFCTDTLYFKKGDYLKVWSDNSISY